MGWAGLDIGFVGLRLKNIGLRVVWLLGRGGGFKKIAGLGIL